MPRFKARSAPRCSSKLFPDWPDDRRGAPNEVIRSAIFGVVRTGRRKRVVDLPVAGPAGSSITITGWRLDQYDLDIWLEVTHLARNTKPGETVRFTLPVSTGVSPLGSAKAKQKCLVGVSEIPTSERKRALPRPLRRVADLAGASGTLPSLAGLVILLRIGVYRSL